MTLEGMVLCDTTQVIVQKGVSTVPVLRTMRYLEWLTSTYNVIRTMMKPDLRETGCLLLIGIMSIQVHMVKKTNEGTLMNN